MACKYASDVTQTFLILVSSLLARTIDVLRKPSSLKQVEQKARLLCCGLMISLQRLLASLLFVRTLSKGTGYIPIIFSSSFALTVTVHSLAQSKRSWKRRTYL